MAYTRGLFKRLEDLPLKQLMEKSKYMEETRLIFDAYKGNEMALKRYRRDSVDPYKPSGLIHYHADQTSTPDMAFRANPDLFSKDTVRSDPALPKATDSLKSKGYGRMEEPPSSALSSPDFQPAGSGDFGDYAEWYNMSKFSHHRVTKHL